MNWKDIIKAPYDMKEFDKEQERQWIPRLQAVLGEFDDRIKEEQRNSNESGPVYVWMTNEEYDAALRAVQNDYHSLIQLLPDLYNVSEFKIHESNSNSGRVVEITR